MRAALDGRSEERGGKVYFGIDCQNSSVGDDSGFRTAERKWAKKGFCATRERGTRLSVTHLALAACFLRGPAQEKEKGQNFLPLFFESERKVFYCFPNYSSFLFFLLRFLFLPWEELNLLVLPSLFAAEIDSACAKVSRFAHSKVGRRATHSRAPCPPGGRKTFFPSLKASETAFTCTNPPHNPGVHRREVAKTGPAIVTLSVPSEHFAGLKKAHQLIRTVPSLTC